jgi:hypothetical protein
MFDNFLVVPGVKPSSRACYTRTFPLSYTPSQQFLLKRLPILPQISSHEKKSPEISVSIKKLLFCFYRFFFPLMSLGMSLVIYLKF